MMSPDSEPGNSKTLYWILGAVFSITLVLMGVLITGLSTSIAAVNDDAGEALSLTTKHDAQITALTSQLDKMDKKLDQLLNFRTKL